MKAYTIAVGVLVCAMAGGTSSSASASDPTFDSYWHDGKAELDGYRLSVQRYGHPRTGRGVLVYVTEPFSESKHVKVDDAFKHPSDTLDAFKLNIVRSFQTGIYDYHTMVSLFTRSRNFAPVKITFTSAEWCGQVYEHLDFSGTQVSARFDSYFEGESSASTLDLRPDGVAEDDLFILLRGLRGAYLKPGASRSIPFLASSYYRRLAHKGLAWSSASIARSARGETVHVPAGTFVTDSYVIQTADGREGRFEVERDYPHRIVRWAWKAKAPIGQATRLGGTDSGELTGTARLEYWKLHNPGDEQYLKPLGLEPVLR